MAVACAGRRGPRVPTNLLDAYRTSVATLGGGGPAADPYRSEIDRMLLELADHDGDIERRSPCCPEGPSGSPEILLAACVTPDGRLTSWRGWDLSRHPGLRTSPGGGTHHRARRGRRGRLP